MTSKLRWLIVPLLTTAAIAFLRPVKAPDPLEDWIIAGNQAIGLMAPIAVADGVEEAWWTGDGSALVILRREPRSKLTDQPSATLESWNLRSRRRSVLMRLRPNESCFIVTPVGASSSAIATIDSPNGLQRVLIDTNRGTTRGIDLPGTFEVEVRQHPERPLLAYTESTPGSEVVRRRVYVMDSGGQVVRSGELPEGAQVVGFSKGGGLVVWRRRVPPATGRAKMEAFEWLANDAFAPIDDPNQILVPDHEPAERRRLHWTSLDSGPITTRPVIFETDPFDGLSNVLASPDADEMPMLNPNSDALLLQKGGLATVRLLVRMPKDEFLKLLAQALKARTMSNAKQVGTALLIYASDFDDMMPEGPITDKVDPYLKDRRMLGAFVYTFAGGDLGKLDNPAGTEIGFMPGPGGRAIVYADGHVKWRPDPN